MQDWLIFEGCVQPMEWGKSVYTVLAIPDEIYEILLAKGAKRVEIELNDCAFNLALTKAPVIDQAFVYTGKSVLSKAAIEPGDLIDVRLCKADPNHVDVPQEVALAILQNGVTECWEELSAGKKRRLLHPISQAKRAETKANHIAVLIDELRNPTAQRLRRE